MFLHPSGAGNLNKAESSVIKFQSELHQPRASSLADLPERAIESITVGVQELRMIKRVEEFSTEFNRLGFAELGPLEKGNVPVVDPRPAQGISAQIAIGRQ